MQYKTARFSMLPHSSTVCHHRPTNIVVYTYETTCMATQVH